MSDEHQQRVRKLWPLAVLWGLVGLMLVTDEVRNLPRDFGPVAGVAAGITISVLVVQANRGWGL